MFAAPMGVNTWLSKRIQASEEFWRIATLSPRAKPTLVFVEDSLDSHSL